MLHLTFQRQLGQAGWASLDTAQVNKTNFRQGTSQHGNWAHWNQGHSLVNIFSSLFLVVSRLERFCVGGLILAAISFLLLFWVALLFRLSFFLVLQWWYNVASTLSSKTVVSRKLLAVLCLLVAGTAQWGRHSKQSTELGVLTK